MTEQAAFYVLYRFKVKPGMEGIFKEGWRRMTQAIREQRGGLGSRLHRADDGWWVAYAKWPNRQAWASSQQRSESPDRDAAALMAEAIMERLPPIPLEPEIDLIDRRAGKDGTP
ncbi:antibiotic biosynthesis monooxygenase family protein [Halomonas organivorans]|uniref:Heme-degrading monooxygenase HmoA n=1 Tax=Halomonas organivorans TaxID=257772 RepID=A0A7W5G6Z0_9GAMM|nr:antibiotic biosynthesis monooxygenase [Halomonas organivorans]MBB3143073.1 heme-degrading monooxygenase HmoA [Halomonas organivorans]